MILIWQHLDETVERFDLVTPLWAERYVSAVANAQRMTAVRSNQILLYKIFLIFIPEHNPHPAVDDGASTHGGDMT
ncbi:hypothetical protein ASF29_05725 [Rhizobium sp. Leaf262]|nr:hypothetical protein ASF29_05725 [Rhizobium sp. Leaf262]